MLNVLAEAGFSVAEIATMTGWSRGVTHKKCQIHGIKTAWHKSIWSKREDDFLRENKKRGWIWCAKQLDRPLSAVYRRVKRLGVQGKHLKSVDLAMMHTLHADGATTTVIAERLGVTAECIRCNLREIGLPSNGRDEKKKEETRKKNRAAKLQLEFSLLCQILHAKATNDADKKEKGRISAGA